MATIELSKPARADAVASLKRYFEENFGENMEEKLPEPLGDLPAGLLLNFILEEIGPAIYNKAVAETQARIQLHVSDLTGELYADEFQYWPRIDKKRRDRR